MLTQLGDLCEPTHTHLQHKFTTPVRVQCRFLCAFAGTLAHDSPSLSLSFSPLRLNTPWSGPVIKRQGGWDAIGGAVDRVGW